MTSVSNILDVLSNLKTGWKTSEFWVTITPVVVVFLKIFGVSLSNTATTHLIIIAWGAVTAVYIAARTFIKSVHLGHAASLAAILSQVEQVVGIGPDVQTPDPVTPTVTPLPPPTS